MTTTLNLYDHLLSRGKKFQDLGRVLDALESLGRLAALKGLPEAVASECHERLGEIQLKRKRYKRAVRHLETAIEFHPGKAKLFHLLGLAWLADGRGDYQKADDAFRQSLQLDDTQEACLTDAGLVAMKLGQSQRAVELLQRAAELAPNDGQVIGKLARVLRLAGKGEEARQVLRAALFRNPHSPRFRKLWNDNQFLLVRQEQERSRLAEESNEGFSGMVILPFTGRITSPGTEDLPEDCRLDPGAELPGPHAIRLKPRSVNLYNVQ